MDDKPITQHMKLLPQVHVRLHQDFYSLVKKQNKKYDDERTLQNLLINVLVVEVNFFQL